MPALDGLLSPLPGTGSIWVALGLALLLGFRHAADPDHLAAVATLVADETRPRVAAAARLGLAWGAGHALTLAALGVPAILARPYLPEAVRDTAELLVGIVIVGLSLRLLRRWRRERLHVHVHEHQSGLRHAHLHGHGPAVRDGHAHPHAGRKPLGAFAVGLLHGVGGSAGPAVLLLASLDSTIVAAWAVVLLAIGTAVSMTALSTGLGLVLVRLPARPVLPRLAPVLGAAGLCFGAWYGLAALAAIPGSV